MTPETVITIGQGAIEVVLVFIATLLLPALGVGLIVSMFQAATQINEQTLSFIPKLFIVFAVMLMAGNWLLGILINYTNTLFDSIPSLIG
jgi:flagellar biosynthetic protein FliQ